MFNQIKNPEFKQAFDALKKYVDTRFRLFVLVMGIVTLVVSVFQYWTRPMPQNYDEEIAALRTQVYEGQIVQDQPQSAPVATATPLSEMPEMVLPTEPVTTVVPVERVNVPVQIGYNAYNPMWEYLEYGNTVEYFHPEGTNVTFSFTYGDQYYFTRIELTPPQMRALIHTFPSYVTYYKDGFTVNATIQGDAVVEVLSVESELGIVWLPSREQAPRELNTFEKWSMDYANELGYEFEITDWFDRLPECGDAVDYMGSLCRYTEWSPAEIHARAQAFYHFATNPDNNVWVEIWGAVDARYRWTDAETGELLDHVDLDADLWELPASGWLGLEIGVIGNGTYDEPEKWETTMTMKVTPGFVVGIDQAGFIFESGPLGWTMFDDDLAYRTRTWDLAKIELQLQLPSAAE